MEISNLESAFIAAMKNAMTIDDDSDNSLDTQPPPQPTEHLLVKLVQNASCVRIILSDYLVETCMYEGTATLGDQNQYALAPIKADLVLTLADLTQNTWIEFVITNGSKASIWLRTSHIWARDTHDPLELELVDSEYTYVVRAVVMNIEGNYYFKNLGIQTIK